MEKLESRKINCDGEIILFQDMIKMLIESSIVNDYNDETKNAWVRLGFDEFLSLFKHALP